MDKLPYETIAPQAEVLLNKAAMALASGASTEEVVALYKNYRDYLTNCGWTVQEYDREQLAHIDTDWDDPTQN